MMGAALWRSAPCNIADTIVRCRGGGELLQSELARLHGAALTPDVIEAIAVAAGEIDASNEDELDEVRETLDEVREALADLREALVDALEVIARQRAEIAALKGATPP